jgi:Protein of unknown function (DUF2586)
MALPSVNFVLGTADIGQAAASYDGISGVCFYGTAPGSFATTACQAVYGVSDAASKGIVADYADETKATGSLVISSVGSTGDTITISVVENNPVTPSNPTGTTTVTLCTYTQASGDTTATLLAASIAAAINANTYLTASMSGTTALTGYTATASSGTITFTARGGLGINLNTRSVTATVVGSIATGTNTAFSGGVYSKKAVWAYQVSEYFRQNPSGVLWVGFFSSVSSTFADIVTLQNAAKGAIRQIGIFDPTSTSASTLAANVTLIQAQAAALFANYTPVVVHYAPNIKATSDLSTLVNLQTKSAYYVSVVLMQDGGAAGAQLFINSGISMANLGCSLGVTSTANVNQCIGEIGAFNITNDVEMSIPAMANGNLISSLTTGLLTQLDAYRYMFATGVPNISGTYIVEDWSSISQTSPYYRQSRNRTMNKAIRLVYAAVIPLLKSQIELNADGTISAVSVAKFTGVILPVIAQMKAAGEVSNMTVTLNASQNIISTGKLVMAVAIQPTITADFIECDMSFVAKI